MLANILVVAFILAMIYWMALQGFFSAFLHLMLVLIAGSLAFALWEPLVFNFGMKMQPEYAWGLWLLGPFVLMLIALRLITDRVVRGNVNFQNLISNALGAVCGLIAGVLTAGIALIGLGFLPLPSNIAGLEPYVVSGGGKVEPTGTGLWIPVDTIANDVFAGLAHGAFATATPMGTYQPDLAMQASLYRMGKGYDENASILAVPGSVEATQTYTHPAPVAQLDAAVALKLGPAFNQSSNKLVVVDTEWTLTPGTHDADAAVRIPPTQIRLVTQTSGPGGALGELSVHAPVGYSQAQGQGRVFRPFDTADVVAFGNRQTELFAWVFLVPSDQTPRFLLTRHLRLELPEPTRETEAVVAAMGSTTPVEVPAGTEDATADAGPSDVGDREGMRVGNVASEIENTNRLPRNVSKNFARSLTTEGTGVMEGQATVARPPASVSRNTVIDSVYVAPHQAPVRLRIEQDRARSLLGQARVSAASLQGVWITDAQGDRYQPIGYVWHKSGGEQQISVDRMNQIRSARQLPVSEMGSGDELYLYFAVPKGARIVSYNIGETTQQQIDPPLVAN